MYDHSVRNYLHSLTLTQYFSTQRLLLQAFGFLSHNFIKCQWRYPLTITVINKNSGNLFNLHETRFLSCEVGNKYLLHKVAVINNAYKILTHCRCYREVNQNPISVEGNFHSDRKFNPPTPQIKNPWWLSTDGKSWNSWISQTQNNKLDATYFF